MISGIVVRVENKTSTFPAAIVTVAGEVVRGDKPLVFFEQVRLKNAAATKALDLKEGEAVLFDSASVEQLTWDDPVTKSPRSQIVIRALGFARLGKVMTKMVGTQAVLVGAMNTFAMRGRLVRDAKLKDTKNGKVCESTIAMTLGEGEGRTHYFNIEGWHTLAEQMEQGKKGDLTMTEVMVKTDASMIDGERRYFTKLESRAVATLVKG